MKFHSVHGSAVTLTDGKTTATRSDNHFCNGIVFSDQPIKPGQKVCVQVSCTQSWSGALRIGLCSNDPLKIGGQSLPKYALPHFSKKDGFWIRPISESLTGDDTLLMFYIGTDGTVQFFVNNEHKGALLTGLPVDKALWVLFDVYGNTKSIKFVKPDDAPREITARGPDAISAFESACRSGMRPVYKSRLMLVGQDGSGKTTLKKALLGQKPAENEEETSGIDLSTSCSFCIGCHSNWSVSKTTQDSMSDNDGDKQGFMGDVNSFEEEYNQALATNIVQELLYAKRRKPSQSTKTPKPSGSRESQRISVSSASSNTKKLSTKPSSASMSTNKFGEIPPEVFTELPERVVELVQKMLDSGSDVKSQDSVSMVTKSPSKEGATMVLNIWDFAGKEVYYTTHQVFLTNRAVYVIVLDLTKDLQLDSLSQSEQSENEALSTLEYMDFWMRSIYAHASTPSQASTDHTTYTPPILIVGTHKDKLDTDPELCGKAVEEKFAQIQDFLVGKPYVQHLVTPFFAVDNTLDDDKLSDLRGKIEQVASQESYIGERMPIRWLRFEQEITNLVVQGTNYASYDQVTELAGNLGITDYKEVMTMLEFYHDLGVIVYYGTGKTNIDNLLRNTVILKPQWLVDMFRYVVSSSSQPQDKWNLIRDKWTRLEEFGILEEVLLDTLWHEARDQKLVLLGLLEKFDLICERLPSLNESQTGGYLTNKSYYVPPRLSRYSDTKQLYTVGEHDVTFYIDTNGFLPGGLFQRILTRTVRWSQNNGGQNPYYLYRRVARFYLDTEHDFILQMAPNKYSRIKVVILRISNSDSGDNNGDLDKLSPPSPDACAKVRNFLDSSLCQLREMWMKRISYTMCVTCPCERICEVHKQEGCSQESCLHFLYLDECLVNKIVMCDHRRIKTSSIKKCFPEPLTLGFSGPVLPPMSLMDSCGNIEKHCPFLPSWVKSAAKLLNNGDVGKDWNALAGELGYKQNQINTFNDDLNPGLALLADWIITSGNTGLSVDMLTVYLEKLDREDIVEVIQKAQESEQDPAQVFISYQWDCQDDVKLLRDRLERSGFTCWMDVGQLGGGDHLYTKIDEAIRHCKAVIACTSPKYVVSQHCMKELSLADLLRKPIIPVMIEKTLWPPPGGMSLIFSQLVYINMKGVGGHGGTGLHADTNDKYKEIIQRISLNAIPDLSRCIDTETDRESSKHQFIDNDLSSTNFSHSELVDRLSTDSSFSVMTLGPSYAGTAHTVSRRRPSLVTVEQVHVRGCKVCTIL